jgi:enoyl-CoA hydratase
MTTYRYLAVERRDAALLCAINNPPHNFLKNSIVTELAALADEIAVDESVRALVITGGVEGIFITHYDVAELVALTRAMQADPSIGSGDSLHVMHQLLLKLQGMRVPVIAAINGTAMGGGCELALACDFRLIARGGRIGLPEVRVGILPGAGGTQRMARLLGAAKALEMMLLGNTVDAESAERIGLVHRAVDPEQLLPEALALAAELATRPPLSVALIKQCVLQGSGLPLADALRLEQDAFWHTMRSDDAHRLMSAYLEGGVPLDQV